MILRHQMVIAGRRMIAAGLIAMATGLVLLIIYRARADLGMLALGTLFWFSITLALQSALYWSRLHRRLRRAPIVDQEPEALPFDVTVAMPRWHVALWIGFLALLSWGISSPALPLYAGGALVGYGCSAPILARRVERLEGRHSTFYITFDIATQKSSVVRYALR